MFQTDREAERGRTSGAATAVSVALHILAGALLVAAVSQEAPEPEEARERRVVLYPEPVAPEREARPEPVERAEPKGAPEPKAASRPRGEEARGEEAPSRETAVAEADVIAEPPQDPPAESSDGAEPVDEHPAFGSSLWPEGGPGSEPGGGGGGGEGSDGAKGGPSTLGLRESAGLCARRPEPHYPESARRMGIEGTVKLRVLVGADGRTVRRKDQQCRAFHEADRKERRLRWHPTLCIEALSGPEALTYDTLLSWGTARWRPWRVGDEAEEYFALVETRYELE